MATSNYIQNKIIQESLSLGRGLLSVQYPQDIEMYLVAMELVDSNGDTEQYFVFPVNPSSIQKTEQNRTNIKKSASGTTILVSSATNPSELSIKGDFGRSFKILTNPKDSDFTFGFFSSNTKDKFEVGVSELDTSVKSGFGCIKILQSMVKKTSQLGKNNKPYRLYFYNMALGESYLVSVPQGGLILNQSTDRNMVWEYSLNMMILAPLESIKLSSGTESSLSSILSSKTIQNGVNTLASEISNVLTIMSDVTDKFKLITGYDIESFLNDYIEFTSSHFSNIVNYYNGGEVVRDSFNYLDDLNKEVTKIDGLFNYYKNHFNTVDFWELIDLYSDIKVKLMTVNNYSKWSRSSRLDRYSSDITISYVQKQGETIERISDKSGSEDSENDWVQLAINNDLNEEKYTSSGGVILSVRLKNNFNFDISNIVDTLSEENLYGKDIQNKIEIVDGDIVSLSGEDSLMQTISNIFSTQKGDIPEYPEYGTNNNLIGSNVNIFSYPTQFRDILTMLQRDDRFKSLTLLNVSRKDDYTYMSFQVKTKVGDTYEQQLMV